MAELVLYIYILWTVPGIKLCLLSSCNCLLVFEHGMKLSSDDYDVILLATCMQTQ